MADKFELYAFYSNRHQLLELIDAGIDGIIIDWESEGKHLRQQLYNTQVNEHGIKDLKTVVNHNPKHIICRINGPYFLELKEIDLAIELGADEILIPMVRTLDQAKSLRDYIGDRAATSFMLETNEALNIAEDLDKLDATRFFLGLNDLSIERESQSLFLPLIDGTLEELRPKISSGFGVAGLTHPKAGYPIPCSNLIKIMRKYRATFGFLRRSFYRDVERYSIAEILSAIRLEFSGESTFTDCNLSKEEQLLFSTPLL